MRWGARKYSRLHRLNYRSFDRRDVRGHSFPVPSRPRALSDWSDWWDGLVAWFGQTPRFACTIKTIPGEKKMSASSATADVPWWKEPTKDQWYAYLAAWLGWTLDAFDFTVFLLIMLPISQEFGVPLTAVTAVFAVTLWMRLVGATVAGWMADRMGRKTPLMISIIWYSVCNFIAGFSPNFAFLFFFRALLGIGMGAEWPAGAALAMETWPTRSRGFMSGVLQGSWGIGFALSALAYGFLYAPFEAMDTAGSSG